MSKKGYYQTVSIRPRKRMGRPLLGKERLSERITVMVEPAMKAAIEAKAGGSGRVGDYVRRLLEAVLSVSKSSRRPRAARSRGAGVRRYGR